MTTGSAPAHPPMGRVVRNTVALAVGRNVSALARLAMLAIVARGLGTDTFGQYAVLIALLMVAEGLVDFGSNETFVREVSAQPQRRAALLRVLAAGRLLHAPAAWLLLVAATVLLGYDAEIVKAAALGGASLLFIGGVMVFRVLFRVELTMEREVAAEFVSVLFMVVALILLSLRGGGIVELMACHVASRALYFALAAWFVRHQFRWSLAGVTRADLAWSWRLCLPVGVTGSLVMLYDPMDVLLLSRLASIEETAQFAAAQRLAWPLLIALSAIGGTVYSLAAASWPHDPARLQRICQRGFDTVVVGGLGVACGGIVGAEALLGLISHELGGGSGALVFALLVTLCVAKAVSGTLGPVLLIVGASRVALAIVGLALVVKFLAALWWVPQAGIVGLAVVALVVELACVVSPALWVVARRAGVRLDYRRAVLALSLCGAVALLGRLLPPAELGPAGRLALAAAASGLYLAVAVSTRLLDLGALRQLRGPAAGPAADAGTVR